MISISTSVQSGFEFCWFACDFDLELILIIDIYSVNKNADVRECFEAYEYAACRVLGACPHMDSDACPVGYVADLRHEFLELRRPGVLEGVYAFRNEVIRVLKRVIREGAVRVEGERYLSCHGSRLSPLASRLSPFV